MSFMTQMMLVSGMLKEMQAEWLATWGIVCSKK